MDAQRHKILLQTSKLMRIKEKQQEYDRKVVKKKRIHTIVKMLRAMNIGDGQVYNESSFTTKEWLAVRHLIENLLSKHIGNAKSFSKMKVKQSTVVDVIMSSDNQKEFERQLRVARRKISNTQRQGKTMSVQAIRPSLRTNIIQSKWDFKSVKKKTTD